MTWMLMRAGRGSPDGGADATEDEGLPCEYEDEGSRDLSKVGCGG
jgi:hypothetical protein